MNSKRLSEHLAVCFRDGFQYWFLNYLQATTNRQIDPILDTLKTGNRRLQCSDFTSKNWPTVGLGSIYFHCLQNSCFQPTNLVFNLFCNQVSNRNVGMWFRRFFYRWLGWSISATVRPPVNSSFLNLKHSPMSLTKVSTVVSEFSSGHEKSLSCNHSSCGSSSIDLTGTYIEHKRVSGVKPITNWEVNCVVGTREIISC